MSQIQNKFDSRDHIIYKDLTIEKPTYTTKPAINCIVLDGSRLFYLLKEDPSKRLIRLKNTSSVINDNNTEKLIIFWQYLGNNLEYIKCILNFKRKNLLLIIDDAYEGLLDDDKKEYIEQLVKDVASQVIFVTSNFNLKGFNVQHIHYHLLNRFFDNIQTLNEQCIDHPLNRNKKFLCLNSIPRPHRLELVDFFIEHDLLKHSYISCKKRHIIDTVVDVDSFVYNQSNNLNLVEKMDQIRNTDFLDESNTPQIKLDQKQKNRLDKNLPLLLDTDDSYVSMNNNPNPKKYFYDSYWSIVGERDFYNQKFLGYTEKIIKCILYKHPFIVVGLPYTLKYLKDLGFITFSSVVDESYDTEENPKKRLDLIKQEILKLNNFNYAEHLVMRKELNPILEYNRDLYLQLNKNSVPNKIITAIHSWYYN